MRAVLDCNVLVSGVISRSGPPAELLRRWLGGEFELVVSRALLSELEAVLAYPKIERRLPAAQARELMRLLEAEAVLGGGTSSGLPSSVPRPPDPDDEYLIALAVAESAVIVSGDHHLTDLAPELPIYTPAGFVELLNSGRAD